ncbi:MAG: hypothetical protein R3301_13930, partial [Saprospiraceae bacterium]|nr:hypothetical protein [Saprospiraceae bacterium]
MMSILLKRQAWCLYLLCLPLLSLGQGDQELTPVTSTYVLKGATVVTQPGTVLENTTILVEDGLIRTVGSRVPIPSHAKVIECDSLYVYAGFIEALSHTGIPARERDRNEERPKVDNPGSPPNDVAGIVPDRSVRDVLKADDKSIEESRKVGFTLSHVVPRGQMLPGKGSLVLLGEGEVDALILKENVSLYAQFSGARGMYPATVIAVMAKWRDLYRQAMYRKEHRETFASNGGGVERPRYDRATEAMFDVIDGLPVYFNAWNSNYMHQAYHLADDLGFNLIIGEAKQGFRLVDKVRAAGKPVVVSLDLPEDKSEKSKKKKDDEEAEEKEMSMAEKERAALVERRQA